MPQLRHISWDANTEPDLLGYKIYAGTSTGNYDDTNSPLDVGNVTRADYTPALDGTRFYAVTAYDSEALESDFSDEVEFIHPNTVFFA